MKHSLKNLSYEKYVCINIAFRYYLLLSIIFTFLAAYSGKKRLEKFWALGRILKEEVWQRWIPLGLSWSERSELSPSQVLEMRGPKGPGISIVSKHPNVYWQLLFWMYCCILLRVAGWLAGGVGKSDFHESPVVSLYLDLDFGPRLRVCQ